MGMIQDPFGGWADFDLVTAANAELARLQDENTRLWARNQWLEGENQRLQAQVEFEESERGDLLGLFDFVQRGLVVKDKPKPTLKSLRGQIDMVLGAISDGLRQRVRPAA